MGFIQRIKEMWTLSQRLTLVENELNELDKRLENAVNQYSKQFENKIKDMTFSYTKNLDDTKSDYLKRYLEVRLNCMDEQVRQLPGKISNLQKEVDGITLRLEEDQQLI
jgi:uncharacterized protein YicC (UPF0701 family)